MGGPGLEEVYSEGEVKVFRLTDPMPRAWLVHNVVMADDEEGFELLNAEDFDLRSIAILPPASSAPALPGGAATSVTIVAAEPGQLVVALDSSRPGLLVISQPFYPAGAPGSTASQLRCNAPTCFCKALPYRPAAIAFGSPTAYRRWVEASACWHWPPAWLA